MRVQLPFRLSAAAILCCAALVSVQGTAAEFANCKTGDEPNVTCAYAIGNWGCDGPCTGNGNKGPLTVFKPPAGYQVCKPLITRQDVQNGECFFAGGPSELQIVCAAPNASARARVHEVTVYSISRTAAPEQFDKYKCVKW